MVQGLSPLEHGGFITMTISVNMLGTDFIKKNRSTHSHTMIPFDTPGKQAF